MRNKSLHNFCLDAAKNILVAAALIILPYELQAQKTNALPRSTPQKEGISAVGIDSFLNAVNHSGHEFHSFMMLRHGKVVAEGWWDPYKSTLRHSLYSTSKSFTSTAIGFAVSEKRLSVNDKVIKFFPNSLPDSVKPYLQQLTVKNLLTMAVGQEPDPTAKLAFTSDDWVKDFLALPILHQPGSKFLYNSMATFMLSAIVQKVTGQKEVDYLKPRLFDPLGITGMDWEANSQGINTGGWGLRLKTEDMAKLGQLYLQKGMWKGKQLLPKEWVEEATTAKIDQAPDAPQSKKDSSDWMQGYCYQFWRCRHDAFRADGAFGQYIIVIPKDEVVIAITSESASMQGELNLIWKYLLPAIHEGSLLADKGAETRLEKTLTGLKLQPFPASTATSLNKTYTITDNQLGIKSIAFNTANNTCEMTLKKDNANYTFNFGNGKWLLSQTDMPGPGLLLGAKEDINFMKPYKIATSYSWNDPQTLALILRYIESPHSETILFHFEGNKLTAKVNYSFNYGTKPITLNGEAAR